MLLIYDRETGTVLENSGTNSRHPEGPPDAAVAAALDRRGIDPATVARMRLHDHDDAELVAQVLANRHHVDVDADPPAVIIDGPYPEPEPPPEQQATTTLHDRARRALDTNATWLNRTSAPSNAQVLAHLDRLTRQVQALIRLEIHALDDVTDTEG